MLQRRLFNKKSHYSASLFYTEKQAENEGMKQGKNKKGKQESPDENINLNVMEAHSYESIYLQIVPYKVKVSDGENFITFALLDSRRH